MKKKLNLDKELVSADLDATALEGGESIACPTQVYPTCITCLPMCNSHCPASCVAGTCPDPME
jgi:hypothetical protein